MISPLADHLQALAVPLAAVTLGYVLFNLIQDKHDRDPPGPKPLPFIGNALDFTVNNPWITYGKWKKKYGDIIFMNILGTRMVVLNSLSACNDLLEKRSSKYSGRPHSVMLAELMNIDYSFPLMGYTPRWRKHRGLFHQYFNGHAVLKHRPVQERSVYHFLQRLIVSPDQFLQHIRLLFGETILDLMYDIKVEDDKNVYIQAAEKAVHIFLEAAIPGQFLVDVFPPLKYIPSWVPGANFKRQAKEWQQACVDPRQLPFEHVKAKIEAGTAGPCVLLSMMDKCKEDARKATKKIKDTPEEMAKDCATVAYLGGADTTLSTIQTIFLLLANCPDAQREAHKELDALLGASPSRLPTYQDRDQLPFVSAIINELLRWHNVLPMGVPHVLTEDDEYQGYLLRKGTIVFANIWHLLHDPERYPDPLTFNPRRWLIETPDGFKPNPAIPDPSIAVFGYGRRVCPGRFFAANSLYITIASVLACFDIRPLDANGKLTERVEEVFTSGMLIYPEPYNVSITPRSDKWVHLIKDLNV